MVLCSCSWLLERPREEDRLSLEVSLGFINKPWYSGDTWLEQSQYLLQVGTQPGQMSL